MEQYLLVGLILYLIALIGNSELRDSLKKGSATSIAAGVIFTLLWFPICAYGLLYALKRYLEKRNEQS